MVIVDVVSGMFLIAGTVIMILGSVGLLRFGDVFLRMHAGTKSSVLGISFIMIGAALHFGDSLVTIKLLALAVIYFFTSPIGAQVLARSAHVARIPMVKETWIDELAESHHTDIGADETVDDVSS